MPTSSAFEGVLLRCCSQRRARTRTRCEHLTPVSRETEPWSLHCLAIALSSSSLLSFFLAGEFCRSRTRKLELASALENRACSEIVWEGDVAECEEDEPVLRAATRSERAGFERSVRIPYRTCSASFFVYSEHLLSVFIADIMHDMLVVTDSHRHAEYRPHRGHVASAPSAGRNSNKPWLASSSPNLQTDTTIKFSSSSSPHLLHRSMH